jgi:hypothetical protein
MDMRKFTINGVEYKAKAIDFNMVCDFEDMGVPMDTIAKKSTNLVRCYFAICSGLSLEEAGKEIEKHIIAGGTMNEVSEVISKEFDESDFFRALSQTTEEEIAENPKKAKK